MFARMPRGTQKKTLVWKKLYRDICEAHSSRENCISISVLLFVFMPFLFALIICVYESNLDQKESNSAGILSAISLGAWLLVAESISKGNHTAFGMSQS